MLVIARRRGVDSLKVGRCGRPSQIKAKTGQGKTYQAVTGSRRAGTSQVT